MHRLFVCLLIVVTSWCYDYIQYVITIQISYKLGTAFSTCVDCTCHNLCTCTTLCKFCVISANGTSSRRWNNSMYEYCAIVNTCMQLIPPLQTKSVWLMLRVWDLTSKMIICWGSANVVYYNSCTSWRTMDPKLIPLNVWNRISTCLTSSPFTKCDSELNGRVWWWYTLYVINTLTATAS